MAGQIFVITGPSGVGKGTLCQGLLAANPAMTLSISATSRTRRLNEAHGLNYFFMSRDEFEAMVAQDRDEADMSRHHLLEWAEYNGNYYGTPRAAVEETLSAGRHMLLEIETQGALLVKKKFPKACLVFIAPPSLDELSRRLRGRGTDTDGEIERRLEIAEQEMKLQDRFDYVVLNEDVQQCLAELQVIVDRCALL